MSRRTRMAGVAIASLLSLATLGEAQAADGSDSLQQEINEVLATTQGGVQISRNEIAWNGGEAILVFPLPGETTAPVSSPAAQTLQAEVAALGNLATTEEPAGDDPEPSASVAAADACPTEAFGNDWYCFYQYTNYGGRRLQWNGTHDLFNPVFFSDYGFENKTSSWSNKGGKTIQVRNRSVTGSDPSCSAHGNGLFLWTEAAHSRSSNVGSGYDNKADCFWTS
ncbi:peptidase inhibitor family I36 protein [Streptomyces sp. NBC_01460]|uniref:peptidase inhibitor family I36 protein n=1 Tax=Streptomyces sp. NBC_01460 TaxID=2903875 RepID=UPI002E321259|nr:peptidase inhibitor family I36 protein [Streptomyces sp. NBC_01460]